MVFELSLFRKENQQYREYRDQRDVNPPSFQGKIFIGKVDVDACPEISKRYKVRNIPTILFMKNGEVVDKHVGSISEGDLRKKLEALL